MPTSLSVSRRAAFWRRDSALGLAVVAAVLILQATLDPLGALERRFYDWASTQSAPPPSAQIVVIAIDDTSIANIGRWPWSREVHAQLIDRLTSAGARTIVHTALFVEPQADRGLAEIQGLRASVAPLTAADGPASPDQRALASEWLAQLQAAETRLDADATLANSLQRSQRVLLPALFTLGEPLGRPDADWPAHTARSLVDDPAGFSMPAQQALLPIAPLGAASAAMGHLNQWPDADGTVRQDPLLVHYNGQAMPSLALAAAAHSLNLSAVDLRLDPAGHTLQLGGLRVPTDAQARVYPRFYPARDGRPAFATDSFHDALTGKIAPDKYRGKTVLIGATAAGVGTALATPAAPQMAPVETIAHTLSSLLGGHQLVRPAWSEWAGLGAVALVALYLVLALPRLSAAWGAAATATGLLGLLGSGYALIVLAATWVPLTLAACVLLIGHLALTTKRFLVTEAGKVKSDEESAETNRMMGLALQGQGQLDMAFDRFRRVPVSDALVDNLMNLAQDFERKRQFHKAEAVYAHIAAHQPDHPQVQLRLKRAQSLSETVMLGSPAAHPGGTLLLADGAVEKPMLGRYQVDKELGKGAMGVVYQGRDPKIGRVVAIKTLALGQEFEGTELDEARARFFREAETAGRLQHPHIVTIYDAGEEHDLAYIAMEFLKGGDLSAHTRAGQLLPAAQVVSIAARVAEALGYAHAEQVVHRDIKPANIMFDSATDTVKVTDFGIARITDSSKTKTGMVLGTPSFMSPEQLAGQKVDGRSDLYSLGVMIFQLLTGQLPFRGDSMAELMFKIAHDPAPDLRTLRPDLPAALADTLSRCLSKSPDERYADGAALAAALRGALAQTADDPAYQRTQPLDLADTVVAENPAAGFEKTEKMGRPPATT